MAIKQKRHRMRWRFWVIAILTKFCTRRVAEDSTRLYGEAAQRRTGRCEDCYTFQANVSAISASSGGTAWTRAGRRLSGALK